MCRETFDNLCNRRNSLVFHITHLKLLVNANDALKPDMCSWSIHCEERTHLLQASFTLGLEYRPSMWHELNLYSEYMSNKFLPNMFPVILGSVCHISVWSNANFFDKRGFDQLFDAKRARTKGLATHFVTLQTLFYFNDISAISAFLRLKLLNRPWNAKHVRDEERQPTLTSDGVGQLLTSTPTVHRSLLHRLQMTSSAPDVSGCIRNILFSFWYSGMK